MSRDAKVVQLRQSTDAQKALPLPMLRLRDAVARRLQALLDGFLDGSDDMLFNLADKAASNQEQTAYFDAMRELRLARKQITLGYLQWVMRSFNEIGRFDTKARSGTLEAVDVDSLALLDHEVLEERVAIEGMINKLRNRCTDGIQLLNHRIRHLLGGIEIADASMPISPDVLCQGFSEACADLAMDIRAKLILYKLFDKALMAQLELLYKEANDCLAAEGVLPDLRRVPPIAARSTFTPFTAGLEKAPLEASEPLSGGFLSDEEPLSHSFEELTSLLHQAVQRTPDMFVQSPTVSHATAWNTGRLVSMLSNAQHSVPNFDPQQTDATGLSVLRRDVQRLVEQGGGAISQVDTDVVNLVAMLFEFILEDRQLPAAMKALLARLQIPVLKVALLDRSFFNRGGHPARKLLNEMATAALGWSAREGGRDPLKEQIERIVSRVVEEFVDDVGLFSALLEEFTHFMDLEQRRRELVEQRLRDAEEGKARHEQARQSAQTEIARVMSGHTLPESVAHLLQEPWVKVLQWIALREGDGTTLWSDHVALAERVVASVDPDLGEPGARDALLAASPVIIDGVRQGLALIGWDPFASDKLLRDLEMAHVDALQLLALSAPRALSDADIHLLDEAPVLAESLERVEALEQPAEQPVEPVASAAVELVSPVEVSEPRRFQWSERRVVPPAPVEPEPVASVTPVTAESSALIEAGRPRAEALRVGSWVEWHQDAERKVRCKLAAVIRGTGKYIFVNRSGAKVVEFDLDGVALALAGGQMNILDDGLIFDRALESIIDNLRTNRKD